MSGEAEGLPCTPLSGAKSSQGCKLGRTGAVEAPPLTGPLAGIQSQRLPPSSPRLCPPLLVSPSSSFQPTLASPYAFFSPSSFWPRHLCACYFLSSNAGPLALCLTGDLSSSGSWVLGLGNPSQGGLPGLSQKQLHHHHSALCSFLWARTLFSVAASWVDVCILIWPLAYGSRENVCLGKAFPCHLFKAHPCDWQA